MFQTNIGRGKAAHHLMVAAARRLDAGIWCVSEPNLRLAEAAGWEMDRDGVAAVVVRAPDLTVGRYFRGAGYVGVETGVGTFVSCYVSPNIDWAAYLEYLQDLGDVVRGIGGLVVVAGDFNAKSPEWLAAATGPDRRGRGLSEWASSLGLVVINSGEHTFERGPSKTAPDVTFAGGGRWLPEWGTGKFSTRTAMVSTGTSRMRWGGKPR